MTRTALRALCIIGLAAGGAGARPFAAAAPPPSLSTGMLPVLLGKTRIVATTNVRGAAFVWIVNGTVVESGIVAGLKDTLSFTNATCPAVSVVQLAIAVPSNGSATTRVIPCTVRTASTTGSVGLDTVSPFRTATGALRPGILSVDSTNQTYELVVNRTDPVGGREPFRVWVYLNYAAHGTDSAFVGGATVTSPMRCPRKASDPYAGSMWTVANREHMLVGPRRAISSINDDSAGVFSPAVARAIAAQMPVDSLAEWARRSRLRFHLADASRWTNGRLWYEECFGPLPSAGALALR